MGNNPVQSDACGLPAGKWEEIFRGARVEAERLDSTKSDRGRATIIGNFLGRLLGREVSIEVKGRTGTATLRSRSVRSGTKVYFFEIMWDEEQSASEDQPLEGPTPDGGPQPARRATAAKPTRTDSGSTPSRESPIDRRVISGSTTPGNGESW